MNSQLYLAKTKDGTRVVTPVEADHFRYYQLVDLEEIDITTSWTGPKIKLAQWRELCAFFEAAYDKHKSEQQARIFFNRETGEFKFWAFPQRSSGTMATNEIEDHPQRTIQEAEIGAGFMLWGTVHHHCSSKAYQSHIDTANEGPGGTQGVGWAGQGGLHITIGQLGSKEYDLHGRIVLRGGQNDVVWSQWFEPPEGSEAAVAEMVDKLKSLRKWRALFPNLPEPVQAEIMEKIVKNGLCQPPLEGTTYPAIWLENVIGWNGYLNNDRVVIPAHGSVHDPLPNHYRHKHHIPEMNQSVARQILTLEERTIIDHIFEIAERYRIMPYRAIMLLKQSVGMQNGASVADQDDRHFLEHAIPAINRSPVRFSSVITAMEIELENEVDQAYGDWGHFNS